jgi:hypothetical protein
MPIASPIPAGIRTRSISLMSVFEMQSSCGAHFVETSG